MHSGSGGGGLTVGPGLSNRNNCSRLQAVAFIFSGGGSGFFSGQVLQFHLGHVSRLLSLSLLVQTLQQFHELPNISVINVFIVQVRHIRFLWFIFLNIQGTVSMNITDA